MKKSFQLIKVSVPASTGTGSNVTVGSVTITEQLRQDYTKVTGVFVIPSEVGDKLDKVTATMKIAGNEILPNGFDLSLINFTGRQSMTQTMYDFSKENIPAKSSDLEMVIVNNSFAKKDFTVYLQLENN